MGSGSTFDWESVVDSDFWVRAAFRNSVTVGKLALGFVGLLPPVEVDLETLLDSLAPLVFGSRGEGMLRVRDETGSRKGAMRKESWGSSRSRDSSRGRRVPLESILFHPVQAHEQSTAKFSKSGFE